MSIMPFVPSNRKQKLDALESKTKVGEEVGADQSRGQVALGEFIWIKTNKDVWWPGQLVDENAVSKGYKPATRSAGKVIVRLYGSYEYKYVDQEKSRSEFEIILKQHNGNYRDIFEKSLDLEQNLTMLKAKQSTAQTQNSESKGKYNEVENGTVSSPGSEQRSRKVRVMQKLGLVAPSNSLFRH